MVQLDLIRRVLQTAEYCLIDFRESGRRHNSKVINNQYSPGLLELGPGAQHGSQYKAKQCQNCRYRWTAFLLFHHPLLTELLVNPPSSLALAIAPAVNRTASSR